MATETEFATNYLYLLSLSNSHEILINNDHFVPLKSLTSAKLPTLPKLPVNKSSIVKTGDESSIKTIKTQFKSIKPPKFSVDLDIPSNLTIYEIKKQLSQELKLDNVEFKLLVKGKVIQDGELLSDVSNDELVKFMVVVTPKPEAQQSQESQEQQSQQQSQGDQNKVEGTPVQQVELPWAEISQLLKTHGFDDNETTLKRLQKGWELTKS